MGLKQMLEAWKGRPVEALLREEYLVARRSIHDIARDWHVSSGTIHSWIVQYELDKMATSLSHNLSGIEMKRIAEMKGAQNEPE